MPKPRLTPSQRRERAEAAHATLTTAIDRLTSSDGWQAMIEARRWLRKYSLGNLLMILAQSPGATDVRPLSAWNEIGRRVRKGERAIRIWAPSFRRVGDGDGRDGDADRFLTHFVLVSVFDASQTDGAPIEAHTGDAELLTGDAPALLWEQINAQITALGYTVSRGDCRGANGYVEWPTRTVRVRADVEPAQAAKTLIHELAHIALDHETRDIPRSVKELEAESVACIVADVAGLDSLPYSVPYVAGWAPTREAVADSATQVLSVADLIIAGLDIEAVPAA
jgi:antirestriction protein ArdC